MYLVELLAVAIGSDWVEREMSGDDLENLPEENAKTCKNYDRKHVDATIWA